MDLISRAARFLIVLQQYDHILKGIKWQPALQIQVLLELGNPQPGEEGTIFDEVKCCLLEDEEEPTHIHYTEIWNYLENQMLSTGSNSI